MVVTYISNGIYHGLSSDTKPTTGVQTNAIFVETDTRLYHIYDGTRWNSIWNRSTYKYFIYLDSVDNKFKAINGKTGNVDFVSTDNTDAQPTIQSALDASSNEPGIIELASNTTFPIVTFVSGSPNRCFNWRDGQWIKGGGWTTKVTLPGGLVGFRGNNITNVKMSDLCVDGNNTNGSNGQSQQGGNIVLTGTTSSLAIIDNVKSINSPEVGIKASSVDYFYAIGNYVDVTQLHNGIGYAGIQSVSGSRASVMIGNHIRNTGGPSLGVNGQGGANSLILIDGNTCEVTTTSPLLEGFGRGQIHIEGDSGAGNIDNDMIISNNIIHNNYYGLHIINGHNIKIDNNIFSQKAMETTAFAGIEIEGETKGITINNNKFHDIAENAINIKSAFEMIRINNNDILNVGGKTSNTYDGIYVVSVNSKTTNIVELKNNVIFDNRGGSARMRDGIRIETTGTGIITNLNTHGNTILGHLGSRVNIIGTGHSWLPKDDNLLPLTFGASGTSATVTLANSFYPIGGGLIRVTTESEVQQTTPVRLMVRRMYVKFRGNTLAGDAVFSLRDDSADVTGTVLTVPAGSTTEVASAELSSIIEAGSKINWRFDTTNSVSGAWTLSHCIAWCNVIP